MTDETNPSGLDQELLDFITATSTQSLQIFTEELGKATKAIKDGAEANQAVLDHLKLAKQAQIAHFESTIAQIVATQGNPAALVTLRALRDQIIDDWNILSAQTTNAQTTLANYLAKNADGLDLARSGTFFGSKVGIVLGNSIDVAQFVAAVAEGDEGEMMMVGASWLVGRGAQFLGTRLAAGALGALLVTFGLPQMAVGAVIVATLFTLSQIGVNIIDDETWDEWAEDFKGFFGDSKNTADYTEPARKLKFGTDLGDGLEGTVEDDGVFGGGGSDTIHLGQGSDYANGGDANDALYGESGEDELVGGIGDDLIVGGTQNDLLVGGEGFDTYAFVTSDFGSGSSASQDVIRDSDGQGKITFNGLQIGQDLPGTDSVRRVSPQGYYWETSDEQFNILVNEPNAEGKRQLIIVHRASGGRIVVNDWANGDLGITIPDLGVPGTPENPIPQTNGDDLIGKDGDDRPNTPESGDDFISGLAGNDGIDGGYGDDWIDGGHGDDLILGGPGSNRLIGGLGNDIILSSSLVMDWSRWDDEEFGSIEPLSQIYARLEGLPSVLTHGNGWYAHTANNDAVTGEASQRLNNLGIMAWGFIDGDSESQDIWIYTDPDLFKNGADEIDAGDGDDTAYGGDGGDTIDGGTGNDLLVGGRDGDFINGGDDDDLILGDDLTAGINMFVGFSQHVSSTANASGNDVLTGGAGNDRIYGQGGSDVIDGGAGNDVLSGDRLDYGMEFAIDQPVVSGNDYIDGGAGDDQIYGDGGDDTLLGGDGIDTIVGDTVAIDGSQHGKDTISGGTGADTAYGMGGDDVIRGDDGNDTLIGDANVLDVALQFHGNDSLYGGAGNDELQGGGGNDFLDGGADDDMLFGAEGNDQLLGGAGIDELAGGEGDDRLDGGAGNDALFGETGNDSLVGGEGQDELQGGDGDDYLDGGAGADKLYGGNGVDQLRGGLLNDELQGGAGNDRLEGGDGNDQLWGDAGEDLLEGGVGNDQLVGGADNDTLDGAAGDDILNGNAGNDLLLGGDGNDNLSGNEDNDTVEGGAGNDYVGGDAGADVLSGGTGDDILVGGDGDDEIEGGTGNDQIHGGTGNNTYVFNTGFGNDVVFNLGGSGNDVVRFGAGIAYNDLTFIAQGKDLLIQLPTSGDSVLLVDFFLQQASTGIALADGTTISKETLQYELQVPVPNVGTEGNDTLLGGSGNDLLYGYGGNDLIVGGTGNDAMDGGSGNDIYRFDSVNFGFDTIYGLGDAGAGSDVIRFGFSSTAYTMGFTAMGGPNDLGIFFSQGGAPISNLGLQGFMTPGSQHVIEFSDGVRLSVVDSQLVYSYTGTANNDSFYGTRAADTMNGGAGNDSLYGRQGNDHLDGGADNDTLGGGEGNDILIGGAGSDSITGDEGDDVLVGGSGNDNLSGGSGDDIYRFDVGFGQDSIWNNDSKNRDAIEFGAGIAPSGIEVIRVYDDLILRIVGTSDELTIGNYFADEAAGALDSIRFQGGNVWDRNTIKAMVLVGTDGDDNLIGYRTDDVLSGGAGNDNLTGNGGNDVLDGGSGDDSMWGGQGHDIYRFGRGSGHDTLVDVQYEHGGEWGYDHYISIFLQQNAGIDTVEFGADIVEGDIVMYRDGNDLFIGIRGTDDLLRIPHYFGWMPGEDDSGEGGGDGAALMSEEDPGSEEQDQIGMAVEFFRFADGTVWDRERILSFLGLNGALATEGDDVIYGDDGDADPAVLSGLGGDDMLYGTEGDDVIDGGAGNDVLDGGSYDINDPEYATSNDVLKGGTGNDVYRFDWGNDTIDNSVGSGEEAGFDAIEVNAYAEEISLQRDGDDLLLRSEYFNSVLTIRDYYSKPDQAIDEIRFVDGTIWTSTDIAALTDPDAGLIEQGGSSSETMLGQAGDDLLRGGDGDDVLFGKAGDDHLVGEDGDDWIYGGTGDDILDGGTGQDTLYGGAGQNVYRFGLGYGADRVIASGDGAIVELGAGIVLADLRLQRQYPDWIGITLHIAGTDDYLTVEDAMALAEIRFADGSALDQAQIAALMHTSSTDGNDTLVGTESGETINGGLGSDWIHGKGGNDTLDGGADHDILQGGEGTDTYVFGRGYGTDELQDDADSIVELGADILPEDVALRSNYLYSGHMLHILGTEDILRLPDDGVAEIRFANGTVWDSNEIRARILAAGPGDDNIMGFSTADSIAGLAGDDSLYGGDGDDVLDGGEGNDNLRGDAGNDVYRFGRGSGQDSITDSYSLSEPNELNIIELGNNIIPADVTLELTPSGSLLLRILGTQDQLAIWNYAFGDMSEGNSDNRFEIVFADGTRWNSSDVRTILLASTAGADVLKGFDYDDVISGGDGNDTIDGQDGNDILRGDAGSDRLDGYSGNDDLDGGSGDDTLDGYIGNDVYRFGRGYGHDTIDQQYSSIEDVDAVVLAAGIATTDVVLERVGDDLVLRITGSDDVLTVRGHYSLDGERSTALDEIRFADGTVWNKSVFTSMLASVSDGVLPAEEDSSGNPLYGVLVGFNPRRYGTLGDDLMHGSLDERSAMFGGAGNDVIIGRGWLDGISGGSGNDELHASDNVGWLYGGSGNDQLYGGLGNDELLGDSGADLLIGGGGDDSLEGDQGDDRLEGGLGDDHLDGGTGRDTLLGGWGFDGLDGGEGDDLIDGGEGDDELTGGHGNDTFVFGRGYGSDVITVESDISWYQPRDGHATLDVVSLGAGIVASDIDLTRDADDLVLKIRGTADQLTVSGYFGVDGERDPLSIDLVRFQDGTSWGVNEIKQRLVIGTEGNDTRLGFASADDMRGHGGNDLLSGSGGNDSIDGGAGNDVLAGDAGNDTLIGGAGNDALFGSAGSDTYWFGRGFGQDRISDYVYAASPDDLDEVAFAAGIASSEVQLERIGDDLRISLVGTSDTITVASHFATHVAGELPNAVERVRFADGTVWSQAEIEAAVSSFAGMAPQSSASMVMGGLNAAMPSMQSGGGLHAEKADVDASAWNDLLRSERYSWRYGAEDATLEDSAQLQSLIASMAAFSPAASTSGALAGHESLRQQLVLASPL